MSNEMNETKHTPERQQHPPAVDDFVATFRCESGEVVGTTTAKIHSVSRHDDGVVEVVIDHWPQQITVHPAITHCDNCGCDWLDNGLNPIGCPYCKWTAQSAEIEALRAEVERLRTDGATAVRWAPSSAHWSSVLRELFGLDARVGIDALEARWRKALERADTAEAMLRQVLEVLEEARNALYEGHPVRMNVQEAITALREILGEGAKP